MWPILRVHTAPTRVRAPDACASWEDPCTDIMEVAPLVCIEVISPEDRFTDLMEKLDEYVAMGVKYNWIVDPWRRKAYAYRRGSLEAVTDRFEADDAGISLSP